MERNNKIKQILEYIIYDSKIDDDTFFIKVNAIKFVGRTLAAFPRELSPKFLEPVFNVLFEWLGMEESMALIGDFSYMADGTIHFPFTRMQEDYDAGMCDNGIEGLVLDTAELLQLPDRRYMRIDPIDSIEIDQKNTFINKESQLEFLSFLRQFIEEYMKSYEDRLINTDMEQALLAFARSFSLEPPEIDLLRLLAVIREMDPAANFFKDYLKISSKKKSVTRKSTFRKNNHKILTTILDSDDHETDILQRGDMFNLAIFANSK